MHSLCTVSFRSDDQRIASASSHPLISSVLPEQEIFRKALAKSPGERLGRLDKQNGRLLLDRVIEKRSAFMNVSSIEELLEQELNKSLDDEPGCYIEIKIVSDRSVCLLRLLLRLLLRWTLLLVVSFSK